MCSVVKINGSLIAVALGLQMWDEHPDVYGVRRSNRSRQEPARLNIGAGVSRPLFYLLLLLITIRPPVIHKPRAPPSGRRGELPLCFTWKRRSVWNVLPLYSQGSSDSEIESPKRKTSRTKKKEWVWRLSVFGYFLLFHHHLFHFVLCSDAYTKHFTFFFCEVFVI